MLIILMTNCLIILWFISNWICYHGFKFIKASHTSSHNNNPKILGIILDEKLFENVYTASSSAQILSRINLLMVVANKSWGADTIMLRQLYLQYLGPKITYWCEVWGGASWTHLRKLEAVKSLPLRICLGFPQTTPINVIQVELDTEPIIIYIGYRALLTHIRNTTLNKDHISSLLGADRRICKHFFRFRI